MNRRHSASHLPQSCKEDQRLHRSICSEAGITLNVKKIIYDKPEVVFGGYLINDLVLSTALSEFPVLKSQPNIRLFCGLANQMFNFSDNISEALAPFKHLLKKGQKFKWNDNLQAMFRGGATSSDHNKNFGHGTLLYPVTLG